MADVNEIISKEAIEGLRKANQYFIDIDGNIRKSIDELKAFNTSFRGVAATQESIVSGQKQMQNQSAKLTQIQKDEAKAIKATESAAARLNKETIAGKQALDAKVRATQQEVKATNDQLGAYDRLTAKVAIARRNYKDLAASLGESNKSTIAAQKEFSKLNDEMTSINKNAGQHQDDVGKYGKVWEGVGKYAAAAGAVFAGVWAAIKFGEGVIKTSQYATDEWTRTTEGLKNGWSEFMNSVANWDFSNLINRINEAAKAGRDYAEVVDLMDKRTKGLATQHKQENEEIAKLRLSYYEHNKSATEKAAIMQKVIDLTQAQSVADATSAKQNYEGYLNTIIQAKGIKKSTLENYLQFKGTTEEKVQLIGKLKEAENYYNANAGILGETDKGVSAAYKTMIELRVKGIGEYSKLESKLSQDQIDQARTLYDSVAEANNAVYENKEGLFRKMELQLKKDDKAVEASIKNQVGAYEKLTKSISDSKEKINNVLALGQTPSNELLQKLSDDEQKLIDIGKAAEFAAQKLIAMKMGNVPLMQSKGASSIPVKGMKVKYNEDGSIKEDNNPLKKRDNLVTSDAVVPMTTAEKVNFAISEAQTVADATFQIMANASGAELEMKLSNLDKEKEARLANSKLTEEQKAKITADYEKKSRKLRTDDAKKQKAAAIIQAIINTALAVTAAMTKVPFSAGAAIAAGIAGAAQIAVISAQKIPQFDAGSQSTPGTFIAGERRPEFMVTPSGQVQLVTRPTLFKNMAGATVIGGEETAEIMRATNNGTKQESLAPYINRMEQNIVNAITNKRELHISASGSHITERQGEYYKTYFNRKISWAGKRN